MRVGTLPRVPSPPDSSREVPHRCRWRNQMRNLVISCAILLTGVAAYAQTPNPNEQSPVEMKATGTPGHATAKRTVRITATVKAIDIASRTLTLQNKAGETQTFKVGPEV